MFYKFALHYFFCISKGKDLFSPLNVKNAIKPWFRPIHRTGFSDFANFWHRGVADYECEVHFLLTEKSVLPSDKNEWKTPKNRGFWPKTPLQVFLIAKMLTTREIELDSLQNCSLWNFLYLWRKCNCPSPGHFGATSKKKWIFPDFERNLQRYECP